MSLVEYLGLPNAYTDSTIVGGSSFEVHVAHAHAALEAGCATSRSSPTAARSARSAAARPVPAEFNPYETPYKPFLPASAYAMAANRHMHEYGTTREQMAAVAVAAREWALLNPAAWEKKPLTIADVLNARPISDPFTVRDICLVTDGGGAIVLVRADRARALKHTPVYVLGSGQSITHAVDHLDAGADAYRRHRVGGAGLSGGWGEGRRTSMSLALYDAFTINTILFLEDLGFCPKGEGGRFVEGGRIAPNGSLAVNTNGGGLSYCHPGMYGLFLLIEAVRQLRGQCGQRQVAGADLALVHGNGGVLSAQATTILGGPATV